MNLPEENDPLDALLAEQNRYIEDDGFTKRVIKLLPRRRTFLRPLILLGTTAIGSVLAILWFPWKNLTIPNSAALLSFNLAVLLPWMILFSIVASLVWGFIAVLQWED